MSYDRVFLYNRQLRPTDVKAILYTKFNMIHDVKLVSIKRSLHLEVLYRRPIDPIRYEEEINKITRTVNEQQCSEFFTHTILQHPQYPDFLVIDGDVIDIPVLIDLRL